MPDNTDVQVQARVLMGEIFLVQGQEAAAREAFEEVLRVAPDTRLDPFEHPPDICAFFDLVKQRGLPPVVSVQPALLRPVSPWLPLGISQLRQHRPVVGTVFALSQGASCGLSAVFFGWLAASRRYGSENEPGTDSAGHRLWTAETLQSRRTVQLSATAVCYSAVTLGFTDAWLAKRAADRKVSVSVALTPSTDRVATDPTVGHVAGGWRAPLSMSLSTRF